MKGFIRVTQEVEFCRYEAYFKAEDISGIMADDCDKAQILIGGKIINVIESIDELRKLIRLARQ